MSCEEKVLGRREEIIIAILVFISQKKTLVNLPTITLLTFAAGCRTTF